MADGGAGERRKESESPKSGSKPAKSGKSGRPKKDSPPGGKSRRAKGERSNEKGAARDRTGGGRRPRAGAPPQPAAPRRKGQGGGARRDLSPIRPAERLLIGRLDSLIGTEVLCALSPECQVAVALSDRRPEARVTVHFTDLSHAEFAGSTQAAGFPSIEVSCAAEIPAKPYDLFLLPFPSHGDLELARELLEQGVDALRVGGVVAAAVEDAGDKHLQQEMKKLFARPQRHPYDDGVVWLGTKTEPLKKHRDFLHEFAFRDGERLIQGVSRPGMISHRRLVGGLRPVLDAMEIRPNERVLNPGCDAGVLALAAAMRAEGVQVVAVDSSPRAVECVRAAAGKNGLTNVEAHVAAGRFTAGQGAAQRGTFDVVVANPPYVTNERVSDVFIDGAYEALKPGGRLILSSKHRVWYVDELNRGFEQIEVDEVRDFNVIKAVKRGKKA